MQDTERRTTTAAASAVKVTGRADSRGRIEGHAAVFYDGTPASEFELLPGLVERIDPGAFDRALRERDDVMGLLNHDKNLILGRTTAGTMTLSIDSVGLRYSIQTPDTQTGKDTDTNIRRGDVSGSSFSFLPTEERFHEEGSNTIRTIMSARLFDVGPVTFPAYEGTDAEANQLQGAST